MKTHQNHAARIAGKHCKTSLAILISGFTALAVAQTPSVRIAGYVDTSLQVMHAEGQGTDFTMVPDQVNATGFQFHVDEDIGNGYGVSAKLYAVAAEDTGTLASPDGALFNHSIMMFRTPAGTFGMGRTGAYGSGFGPIGEWWKTDPFISAYGDAGSQATTPGVYGEVLRNAIFYQTPRVNGFWAAGMFSLTGEVNNEAESNADNTTFWELFCAYDTPNLLVLADIQGFHYGNASEYRHMDDLLRVKLSIAKTFPSMTLYGGWAYGKNELKYSTTAYGNRIDFTYEPGRIKDGMNGRGLDMHSFYVGAKKKIGAWDLLSLAQFQFGENKGQVDHAKGAPDSKFVHYGVSIGANYNLSKRTFIYGALTSMWVGRGWDETQARSLERRSLILGITTAY